MNVKLKCFCILINYIYQNSVNTKTLKNGDFILKWGFKIKNIYSRYYIFQIRLVLHPQKWVNLMNKLGA